MGLRKEAILAYALKHSRDDTIRFAGRLLGLDTDAVLQDEEIWRSTEEGRHFKLETNTGEITGGFGGKLNGQKLGTPFKKQTSAGASEKPSDGNSSGGQKPSGGSGKPAAGNFGKTGGVSELPKSNPAGKLPADWQDHLSAEEKTKVGMALNYDGSVQAFLNAPRSWSMRTQLMDILGKHADWNQSLMDRDFPLLNEKEKEQMNFLLDQFPIVPDHKDPVKAKFPNEVNLQSELDRDIGEYYQALKAKAIGLEGIKIPECPEALTYAMTQDSNADKMRKQDSGYLHTEAGDSARKQVKEKFKSADNLFGGVDGNTFKEVLIASVDNLDDRVAQLVASTMQGVNVTWRDDPECSHYDMIDGNIVMDVARNDGETRTPEDMVSAFWHEYGHYVDDVHHSEAQIGFVSDPLRGFGGRLTPEGVTRALLDSGEYEKAAMKDMNSLLDAVGLSDEFEAVSASRGKVCFARKSDHAVISSNNPDMFEDRHKIEMAVTEHIENLLGHKEASDYLFNQGMPKPPEFNDYFETYVTPKRHQVKTRERFKGAEDAYRNACMECSEKTDAWIDSIGGQEGYAKLIMKQHDLFKAYNERRKKVGRITDCLDEAVNGILGMQCTMGGHDESYYRVQAGPIETVANIFSIRALNRQDDVGLMEKIMPNIAAVTTQAWRVDK